MFTTKHVATFRGALSALATGVMVAGCAMGPVISAAPSENLDMVKGPPISDIVTPFDEALSCLRGRIQPKLAFSVGAIIDQTGKEQLTEGGTGKFVTQGAGDMVQSALFRTGVTVLNRRDPRILETEVKWGVRDGKGIAPSNYFITGSINSLDFLPGGGFDIQVGGVGPQYRQNRILVGLDLSLTDTRTGRVVANVPLQKQIFASEFNFGIGRFMGDELVLLDIGGREREALHFALRQMLNLGTFELLTQVMPAMQYAECRGFIDRMHGFVDQTATAARAAAYLGKARDVEVTPVMIDAASKGDEAAKAEPARDGKQPPAPANEPEQNGNGNGNGQLESAPMSDDVKRIILTN
ncbi:MAG: hypothetical protein KUL79_08180 [Thauera sp.]|nr:hypothetical protein [Thauera sp.]